MRLRTVTLLLIFGSLFQICNAQTLDDTFAEPLLRRAASIEELWVQADGKLLVTGDLAFHGDTQVGKIVRLNPDGSHDDSFFFPPDDSSIVRDIVVQENGNIIVLMRGFDPALGGYIGDTWILLLDSNGNELGSIDSISNIGKIALDGNGRLLISASESSSLAYIFRYNSELTSAVPFDTQPYTNGAIRDIKVHGSDIMICGIFSEVNGEIKNDVARIHSDGTLDLSFDAGTGSNDQVNAITVQSDGKVIVGQSYINEFNGQSFHGTVRLNTDGSIDDTFNPMNLNGSPSRFVQIDNSLYVAAFIEYAAETWDYLVRLNLNGALDQSFAPVRLDLFGSRLLNIALVGDNLIVDRTSTAGNIYGLSKFSLSGGLMDGYAPELSRFGTVLNGDFHMGKLVISGDFIKVNDLDTRGIARLNANGSVDYDFAHVENRGVVKQIKILDDQHILVSTGSQFFKLDDTGTKVNDFNWSPFKTLYNIDKFVVLEDGKIAVSDANNPFRLNADGSEDLSFNIGSGICCTVSTGFDFDVQAGKMIYGSAYSSYNGADVNRLMRLNSDGSLDGTFNIGTGPNGHIHLVRVLDNGEIIVGGQFTEFDGRTIPYKLVKLSVDGVVDDEFNQNQGEVTAQLPLSWSRAKVVQLGNRIIFVKFNRVFAFFMDGSYDPNFKLPKSVSLLSDIVLSAAPTGGRVKNSDGLYAMGYFLDDTSGEVSRMFKINFESEVVTSAGESDVNDLNLQVYPNPARSKLYLQMSTAADAKLTLYNSSGQAVVELSLSATELSRGTAVDIESVRSGLYSAQLQFRSGAEASRRVVIK